MLYLNGKYLDVNDTNGDLKVHAKDYQDKVAKYREEFGRYVTIKTNKPLKINKTGRAEAIPNVTVPLISIVGGRSGTEEWTYSENAAMIKDGVLQLETRQLIIRNGEHTIDLDMNPDLAYFLIEKHVFFKNGKLLIHDERSIAKKEADERRKRVRLEGAIYNESSHLNVNRGMLEMVCKRWGVVNVQKKTKDQLQNELYDKVIAAENLYKRTRSGRGIEEFLDDVKLTDNTKLGALVYDAIENGVVMFNSRFLHWEVVIDSESDRPVLVSVAANEVNKKEEILIDSVVTDAKVRALVEKAMGKSNIDPAEALSFDVDDILKCDDYKLMQKMGAQLKIKVTGVPKDELRSAIVEALHERQTA